MKRIGEILVENNLISLDSLNEALKEKQDSNKMLGEILIEKGYLTEDNLLKGYAIQTGSRPISENESRLTGIKPNTVIRYANALNSEEREQRKREQSLCLTCNGTGYNGRIGVYELLIINANIALRSKSKPLAASNLKNHLKGLVTFFIILIK